MTSSDSSPISPRPLSAWFLGPRAENAELWHEVFTHIFQDHAHWRRNYFPSDPVIVGRAKRRSDDHEGWTDELMVHLDRMLNELKGHYPFHSPRYIAHMLSEQTLPSVVGYFAGMLYNPNNVTSEAAPVTVDLELEVGRMVSRMLGYDPERSWAHITSGGTVANIEALWVARSIQFIPFMIKEFNDQQGFRFEIKDASGTPLQIGDADAPTLLALPPNESIFMVRRLTRHMIVELRRNPEEALEELNQAIADSLFNVTRRGFHQVSARLGLQPRVFVSAAAHYSIKKACDLLGYGTDAVELIPVNDRFRMDADALELRLQGLSKNEEYVAAVVAIAGSTEEGAVDPIRRIAKLRQELSEKYNRSFWLHIDAAWGGYIRSVLVGEDGSDLDPKQHGDFTDEQLSAAVATGDVQETFHYQPDWPKGESVPVPIEWKDLDVVGAFLSFAAADSITVDPHKLGYIPYPSGFVAFRNGLVTEHIVQKAQYISDIRDGVRAFDRPVEIEAVGPYILEGSKPGAAAAAAWLSHSVIPLHRGGHGKVIRTTLLNAKKLVRYLSMHRHMFSPINLHLFGKRDALYPFTFVPLYEPDTNIVCFVVVPMQWTFSPDGKNKQLVHKPSELRWINQLNQWIYQATSIESDERLDRLPSGQPFFVSRTWFEPSQYAGPSIASILERVGVSIEDYETRYADPVEKNVTRSGLFVLRATVMNPWYFPALTAGMDYLFDFVRFLHLVSHSAAQRLHEHLRTEEKAPL